MTKTPLPLTASPQPDQGSLQPGSVHPTRLKRVEVKAGAGGGYSVYVGIGALSHLSDLLAVAPLGQPSRLALMTDSNVGALHADRVEAILRPLGIPVTRYTFPAGESEKSRARWAALTDALLGDGFGRDSAILALGGGVTGDLSGFVASTYMRGIPVVQIPTSLVAMIDSAVGGKTGIDVPAGKNLVGAFHPPAFVLVDPSFTETLPRAERGEGWVEALKHGLIRDRGYFETLEEGASDLLGGDVPATFEAVLRSIEIKAEVVSLDEREGGIRQILNFGHTLGHAIEARSNYAIGHGSAVAAGMVLEAEIGARLGVTPSGTRARIEAAVQRFERSPNPAFGIRSTPEADEVLRLTHADKKARGGAVRYALLAEVGRADEAGGRWSTPVPDSVVTQVLKQALDPSDPSTETA